MSSTFGTLFRVTTFGESHGQGVGAVIDGCPPGISLSEEDIQPQLDRRDIKVRAERLRKAGQLALNTYLASCQGTQIEVLVEEGNIGRTPHFAEVAMNESPAQGSLVAAAITGVEAGRLVGAVLAYLQEVYKTNSVSITSLRTYNIQEYMVVDATTQRNLELVRNARDNSTRGTLLSILSKINVIDTSSPDPSNIFDEKVTLVSLL